MKTKDIEALNRELELEKLENEKLRVLQDREHKERDYALQIKQAELKPLNLKIQRDNELSALDRKVAEKDAAINKLLGD